MIYETITPSDQRHAAALLVHHLSGDRAAGLDIIEYAVRDDRLGQLFDGVLNIVDSLMVEQKPQTIAVLQRFCRTLAVKEGDE